MLVLLLAMMFVQPNPNSLVFMTNAELVIENLEVADTHRVMQLTGDNGAAILWIEEL